MEYELKRPPTNPHISLCAARPAAREIGSARGRYRRFGPPLSLYSEGQISPICRNFPGDFESPGRSPAKSHGYFREGRRRPPRQFGVRAGNPPGGFPIHPHGLIAGALGSFSGKLAPRANKIAGLGATPILAHRYHMGAGASLEETKFAESIKKRALIAPLKLNWGYTPSSSLTPPRTHSLRPICAPF